MRGFALSLLTATGLALSIAPSALAADAGVPTQHCGPGMVWDGYDCVRSAPRARAPEPRYAQPDYAQPPYGEPDYGYEEPVQVERRVYVAPPVYVARPYYAPYYAYARPYYARPQVRYYAPRHGWNHHRPWRRHAWR